VKESGKLKVLLINDNGPWVVQCLQHDIAAQGETPTKALEAFNWTYWAQVLLDQQKGIEPPLGNLEKAPDEYWQRFERGLPFAVRFELKPPFALDKLPSVQEDVRLAS